MKSYLALLRGSYMVGLVYRYGFLFNIAGNVLYMSVTYFLWRSIYQGRETLNGLTFDQTYIYVALGSAVFILLKTYVDWQLSFDIREGMIATYLIKPIDLQLYILFTSLGYCLMSLSAITIPTFLLLIFVFHIEIPLGVGLLIFPFSLVLAYLLSFCFDYFVGLLCFYTESIWGLSITKDIIVTVLSGALIPLQFFPDVIQNVLMWLPFQAIYYTPLTMVAQPTLGWETFLPMLGVQLFWVIALFGLTRLFYDQAIKVLRISGG
ncbi:MAG: ABC-2 family transporter protein [Anaerolineales bacterium]|nr:ABC-2 family transporter protein [Anaerolineales bacterium]